MVFESLCKLWSNLSIFNAKNNKLVQYFYCLVSLYRATGYIFQVLSPFCVFENFHPGAVLNQNNKQYNRPTRHFQCRHQKSSVKPDSNFELNHRRSVTFASHFGSKCWHQPLKPGPLDPSRYPSLINSSSLVYPEMNLLTN